MGFFFPPQFCAFKSLAISFFNSNYYYYYYYYYLFFEVLIYDPYYVEFKM
jgi:hypothetical protein